MNHQADPEANDDFSNEDRLTAPTWEDDIKAFFTQTDIGCMRSAGSKFDLANYDDVKGKAGRIHQLVGSGSMPMGGRWWSTGKVARFKDWMDAEYPRGPRAAEGVDTSAPTETKIAIESACPQGPRRSKRPGASFRRDKRRSSRRATSCPKPRSTAWRGSSP